jgi:hypothetical protein
MIKALGATLKYDLDERFRSRLVQARGQMSQTALANWIGIGQAAISKIEGGLQNTISEDDLVAWAEATDVTTDWLLGKGRRGASTSDPTNEELDAGQKVMCDDDVSAKEASAPADPATPDAAYPKLDAGQNVMCDDDVNAKEASAPADPATPDAAYPKPKSGDYRKAGIVFLLVILGLALTFWSFNSSSKLSISHLRVFDDSYRDGPVNERTLTALHRKAQYYEISSADEFLLALGFVISGYATKPNGDIDVEIWLYGQSDEGKEAWKTHYNFSRPDDWKEMLVVQRLGAPALLREFNLAEGAGIPVITVLQCAEPEELTRWAGPILIQVTDRITGSRDARTVTIDLKKTKVLKDSGSCG